MNRTQLAAWGLSALLAVGCLPLSAFAAEPSEDISLGSIISESDELNSDECFAAFVDRAFGLYPDIGLYNNYGETIFQQGTTERHIYDSLKRSIEQVAQTGGSTKFKVILSDCPVSATGSSEDEAKTIAFGALVSIAQKVINTLLVDCPLDLYWYDKVAGSSLGAASSVQEKNGMYTVSCTSLTISCVVANAYQAGSKYTVTSEVANVTKAAKNALSYVEQYADESDYRKLVSYKDTICELTSYNDDAAADDSTSYGDPWQLIWVFDDNPDTKVVCEGYAKAFQYLCDLTEWKDENIACYITAGTMAGGTGAGGHMWNTVTMDDGKNYLVDVTNSDDGSIGMNGGLFLAGTTGTMTGGYTFQVENSEIKYTYDPSYIELYDTDILTLADTDYGAMTLDYDFPSELTVGMPIRIEPTVSGVYGGLGFIAWMYDDAGELTEYTWPGTLTFNIDTGVISGWAKAITEEEETIFISAYDSTDINRLVTDVITIPVIGKGTLTGTPILKQKQLKKGDSVGTLALSGTAANAAGEKILGTFAWKDASQSFTENGKQTVSWIFTPEDEENYEVLEGSSTITIVDEVTNMDISNAEYLKQDSVKDILKYRIEGNVITIAANEKLPACKVGYMGADGNYVAVAATTNNDGSHSFDMSDATGDIIVVLKGDTDQTGSIGLNDATFALRATTSVQLGELNKFAADLDNDGRISMNDATFILRATASVKLDWDTAK